MLRTNSRHEYSPWQRFLSEAGSLWEFVEIVPIQARVRHAKLVKPTDANSTKIISVNALTDRGLFSLVE